MCNKHYLRWRNNGDPNVVRTGGASLALERNPRWTGDAASYAAIHLRLQRHRGVASDQPWAMTGDSASATASPAADIE